MASSKGPFISSTDAPMQMGGINKKREQNCVPKSQEKPKEGTMSTMLWRSNMSEREHVGQQFFELDVDGKVQTSLRHKADALLLLFNSRLDAGQPWP